MHAFATLAILPVLALAPSADTYTVHPTPGVADFLSPAAALASPLVVDGDRIEVLPGTYVGSLLVDKAVRLVAVAGPAFTVLDAAGGGTVVTITAGATVRGFTITGCGAFVTVGGVAITSTAPVRLAENVIAGNHPVGDVGIPVGGVWLAAGATARLRANEIRGNTSLSVGGFFAGPTSAFELFGDRIHGNGGAPTITGGVLLGGSGRLVNVQITGNHGSGIGAMFWGGGIPSPAGATLELRSCTIYGNVGGSPVGSVGGIFLDDGGLVTVRNTLLHSNVGSAGGDVLFSSDFFAPPVVGVLDVDASMIGMPAPGLVPGPAMLPPFAPAGLVAPVSATPFGPAPFGDFRPLATSLLRDAGLDADFPADLPAIDALGLTRFFGPALDVGALEYAPARVRRY